MKLRGEFESLKQRINGLEQENRSLEAGLDKYSAGEYSDRDIVSSGYITNGGKIISFSGNQDGVQPYEKNPAVDNRFEFELRHLRIIWILFSFIIAFYYFKKRSGGVDEYHG